MVFKRWTAWWRGQKANAQWHITPRSQHALSRKDISPEALKVLYRLSQQGHEAYLVGGGVRDVLLGNTPKDFDVVTNAQPETIKRLFNNCRLIGRRFRLAHVCFGRHIIEVATFRGPESDHTQVNASGRLIRDNTYGTSIKEDAPRRDFTINALYYNIKDFSVIDYQGGLADLKQRVLRVIGDPDLRFQEDPVRMLRAARFAAKLHFDLDPAAEAAVHRQADRLKEVASARLLDEMGKLFYSGHAQASWAWLKRLNLHHGLFAFVPQTDDALFERMLASLDQRVAEGKRLSASVFWATVLLPFFDMHQLPHLHAFQKAWSQAMEQQGRCLPITQRMAQGCFEVLQLYWQLLHPRQGQCALWMEHPRFRSACDLLALNAQKKNSPEAQSVAWWALYQGSTSPQRELMEAQHPKARRRKRIRKKTTKRPPEDTPDV